MSLSQRLALFTIIVSAAVCGATVRAASNSTGTATTSSHSSAKHGAANHAMGKIVSFDAQTGALVIKPRQGADVTVYVDAHTTVTVDGKSAAASDLKPNERAMLSTAGTADHRTAVKIAVRTSGRRGGKAPAAS